MMRGAAVLGLSLLAGCVGHASVPPTRSEAHAPADAVAFLVSTLRPWPTASSPGLIAVTDREAGRAAVYDSALVSLVLLRRGDRARAGRVLEALAALQSADGSLPFSFTLSDADASRAYVRAGAVAWVGYAATEYLDAEKGGASREAALSLAHRAAAYLLSLRVRRAGDPQDGLVRGGSGTLRYAIEAGVVREELAPGPIDWVSVEHNVDAFFFLRALARVTQTPAYGEAAGAIARGLVANAWSAPHGQMLRGVPNDATPALDCASWGSLFLAAAGDRSRAETAYAIGDARYASRDPRTGARGHRAYAAGPLLEDARLASFYAAKLPAPTWDRLDAVWPEGSAGVALAALRTGRAARAKEILDALESLRSKDGSLPTFTADVPYTFDTKPSIAGTAWVELVRFDLERPLDRQTLWRP